MIKRAGAVVFAAAVLSATPSFAATISSNFSTNDEGWQVGDINSNTSATSVGAPTYNAAGGNPGGYIATTDAATIIAFLAPSSYLGNQSSFYGGSLNFSLVDTVPADGVAYPAVVIYSGGQSIAYSQGFPGTTFTNFSVPLTQSGWYFYQGGESTSGGPVSQAQFQSIIGNISALAIEADWHTGDDLTGLDTVSLNSGVVAGVPEPATWGMMLLGFAGLGFAFRQSRRKVSFA